MGQAKKRGDFEQRKTEAIERERIAAAEREEKARERRREEMSRRASEPPRQTERRRRSAMTMAMVTAVLTCGLAAPAAPIERENENG